jgi:hypothetical protein
MGAGCGVFFIPRKRTCSNRFRCTLAWGPPYPGTRGPSALSIGWGLVMALEAQHTLVSSDSANLGDGPLLALKARDKIGLYSQVCDRWVWLRTGTHSVIYHRSLFSMLPTRVRFPGRRIVISAPAPKECTGSAFRNLCVIKAGAVSTGIHSEHILHIAIFHGKPLDPRQNRSWMTTSGTQHLLADIRLYGVRSISSSNCQR